MKLLGIMALLMACSYQNYGQGCSDAGFCTMGAMRPSQIYTRKINFKLREVEFNYSRSSTPLTPTISAATVDFTFGINDKTSMQVKVPYVWVDGSLGNTAGVGDLSVSFTRNVYSNEQFHINATLGGKIPTNNGDLDEDVNEEFISDGIPTNQDLPMYYQTSLGSYDIVGGGSLISKKWMFAAGFQIALTENQNDFRFGHWQNYFDPPYLRDYDLANDLKRGTDIMIRAERAFHFSNVDIRLGVLPIFRITEDEILDVNPASETFNERIKVDGTTGLALTSLLNVAYHFNAYNSVKLLYALKITDRDVNPDGLTRDDVFSLAYVIRF
ncbi:MAG: hypothetical protein AAFN93_14670 [Bacteroidota bacterium]